MSFSNAAPAGVPSPWEESPGADLTSTASQHFKKNGSLLTGKYWLVVSTPLKNISQLGWFFPIYGKLKHVPNHQPEYDQIAATHATQLVFKSEVVDVMSWSNVSHAHARCIHLGSILSQVGASSCEATHLPIRLGEYYTIRRQTQW